MEDSEFKQKASGGVESLPEDQGTAGIALQTGDPEPVRVSDPGSEPDPSRDAETGPITGSSLAPTSDAPRSSRSFSPRTRAILGAIGGAGAVLLLSTPLILRSRAKARAAASAAVAPPPVVVAVVAIEDAGPTETAIVDAAVAVVDAEPPPAVWRIAKLTKEPGIDVIEAPVGRRPLLATLVSAGVSKSEALRALKAFDGVRKFDRCNPKDTFSVAKEKTSGRVLAFEYATSKTDVWQAREIEPKLFEAGRKLELRVERVKVSVAVSVADDLRASCVSAGLDDDVLTMLDDALDGHAELADVRSGARLRIVATEERVEGAFARYAELEAVEYTPANGTASALRVYHFSGGKAAGYYDAKGRQPMHGGWRTPVPFARISSRFNPRRMHPVMHVIMPHNGVDFAASTGTPVYSAAVGTVRSVGDGGPCGNMVQVLHSGGGNSGGLVTAYCHLSRFAGGLRVGQHVEARQLVGYVGQTGRVTGPHLHFAVKRGEMFIDPLALKLDGVKVLPPLDREDFAKARVELDKTLDAIALPAGVPGTATAEGANSQHVEDTIYDEPAP